MKTKSIAAVVDRLGKVKAQQADLAKVEKRLRKELIESGLSEADGRLFRATVSEVERATVDYAALVAALNVPKLVVENFTTRDRHKTVRVVARRAVS
jgi:hypothetical protein